MDKYIKGGISLNNKFNLFYRHLFNGMSFLAPLIITAGILTIITYFFGVDNDFEGLKGIIFTISKAGMALMIPVISGFIAYSISDKAGLIPGLIGGAFSFVIGTGFLGGILSGIICGYFTLWIVKYIKISVKFDGFKFMILAPFLTTLLIGLLMIYVVDPCVRYIFDSMTVWLEQLSVGNSTLFGVILGVFTAFDIGGPFSRAAVNVVSTLKSSGILVPQACVFAVYMTIPLGIALAVAIAKYKYSNEERILGKVLWFFGIFGFVDGGIPFIVADPIRVIPAIMIGSAISGGLTALFGCLVSAQNGGLLALTTVGSITGVFGLITSVLIGAIVIAVILKYLKK